MRDGEPALRRVVDLRGGVGARVQLGLLRAIGLAARPLGQRGVHRVAWRLARWFDDANAAVLEAEFGRMRIPLADGYAVKLLDRGYRYEPEVEPLIREAMGRGCDFIDGGANLGYWSVLAGNASDGAGRVVAVEPVPALFERLQDNADLNDGRFVCLRAALWSEEGEEITLRSHPQWHAGSSAVDHPGEPVRTGSYTTRVPTTTIDRINDRYCPDGGPLLVKLDIEGAEPEALAGAERTLASRETLLLYEDHGSDPAHTSTRHVLEELGYRVFACTRRGPQEIRATSEVSGYKADAVHGFNFFAFPADSAAGPQLIGAWRAET